MKRVAPTSEDACTCRHIRAGHAGDLGICLVMVRAEDIGKRRPRPCPCIGFARADITKES